MASRESIIILSSKNFAESSTGKIIIDGITQNLFNNSIDTVPWYDETLFEPNNATSSIQSFMKNIYLHEAAIILLTADDSRKNSLAAVNHHGSNIFSRLLWNTSSTFENVPRDNVIFELGACMSHFGMSRTFVLMANKGTKVTIPSYFMDFHALKWNTEELNAVEATREACSFIVKNMKAFKYKSCDIGLPAMSAVKGYSQHFLSKILFHLHEPECTSSLPCDFHNMIKDEIILTWRVYIILSRVTAIMNTKDVGTFFKCRKLNKMAIGTGNERQAHVHFRVVNKCLDIFDIPTTISGCNAALMGIDAYYGSRGSTVFQEELLQKEINKFGKFLLSDISKSEGKIEIITDENLDKIIPSLEM